MNLTDLLQNIITEKTFKKVFIDAKSLKCRPIFFLNIFFKN